MSVQVIHVVGTRPNFVKIAPVMHALTLHGGFKQLLVHTGQHYDNRLSQVFFDDLGVPAPQVRLGIGSASHAVQTAQIMMAFEKVLQRQRPDAVLVVGDVNSTLACTLTAVKLQIRVVHVEAGLRSHNRAMPEEINRLVTDALSDLLFATERTAVENLLREGIPQGKIHLVGNVMIDTLKGQLKRAQSLNLLSTLGLEAQRYAVLTLHRPANVDCRETLATLLETAGEISKRIPVLFPLHPRTQKRIEQFALGGMLRHYQQLQTCQPLGYLAFLHIMSRSRFVLTDSGGIQEETTALGIPCLTLRTETERPVTVIQGTNTVVGRDPMRIRQAVEHIMAGNGKDGRVPEKWDGRAAHRIASIMWHAYGPGTS